MSEIRLFYRENNRLKISKNIDLLKEIPLENFVWIDLNDVPEDAETELEQFLKIYIQEEEEMEEATGGQPLTVEKAGAKEDYQSYLLSSPLWQDNWWFHEDDLEFFNLSLENK